MKPNDQQDTIEETMALKETLSTSGQKGLALDIDDTLSYTNGYWMERLMAKFGDVEQLSPEEMVAKYRFIERVPYWRTKEASEMIEAMFQSNTFQEELPLIKHADEVVRRIHALIPIVAYLTARPDTVREGTARWLAKHGFPQAPIILRPNVYPFSQKHVWKAQTLTTLYPEVLGIVENDPDFADYLPNDYQGTLFLYDNTEHSRNDIAIVPCKTWEEVFRAVHSQFSRVTIT